MTLAHNPRIVTDGLVFAYDMGNAKKSWKGAPTTNLYTDGDFSSETLHPVRSGTWQIVPDPRNLTKKVLKATPSASNQYHGRDISATVSSLYSLQMEVYVSPDFNGTNVQMYPEQGGSGGRRSYNLSNKGTWQLLKFDGTSATTSNIRMLAYILSSFTNGYVLISNVQVELSPIATPFVNGTRSNTQSLLDWTGNNTITANSLTYSSDGTFGFNGSSNEMHPPIIHSYLDSSALEVVFISTTHGTGFKTIFGYRHNVGFSLPTIGSIYLNGNTLSASVITAAQVYRTATFSSSIQTNTAYHAVLNKDTVNGTLQLFVNGVAGSVQTFDAATYGQWTDAGSFIGANLLDIAKSTNTNSSQGWGTDYFSGTIPIAKVYNRALTAAEVAQNYNALKGRYGL
jgi:hypothetical protein